MDEFSFLKTVETSALIDEIKSRFDSVVIRAIRFDVEKKDEDAYAISDITDYKGAPYQIRGLVEGLRDIIVYTDQQWIFGDGHVCDHDHDEEDEDED